MRVVRLLTTAVSRDFTLNAFFTGGYRDADSYEGQFREAFSDVAFGDRLRERYVPEADHLVTQPAHHPGGCRVLMFHDPESCERPARGDAQRVAHDRRERHPRRDWHARGHRPHRSVMFPTPPTARILLAVLLAAAPLRAQPQPASDDVLALHLRKFSWMIQRDSARLADLLAPDARFVHSNGLVQDRARILGDLQSGRLEYFEIVPSDTGVRHYPNGTAVVHGRMRVRGAIDGTGYTTDLLYTEVYLREGRGWRLVTRHASRAP